MSPHHVTGAAMLRAATLDPQLRLPARPRLIRELAYVFVDGGLLVEGTEHRQRFRGAAVDAILPGLFELLDGTRSLPEIAALAPELTEREAYEMIALLASRGLLEDAAHDVPVAAGTPQELVAYARRHVDTTRRARSASESLARLAAAEVAVLGAREAAGVVVDELRACGVAARACELRDLDAKVALVVALLEPDTAAGDAVAIDERCAELDVRWLHTRRSGDGFTIGPCFHARRLPCYGCYAASDEPAAPASDSPAHAWAWACAAAIEAVNLISWIGAPVSGPRALRWQLSDHAQRSTRHVSQPGCARCLPRAASHPPSLAFAYEQAVAPPPAEYLDRKQHQLHYHVGNLELQRQQRSYPRRPSVALPPGPAPQGQLVDGAVARTPSPPAALDLSRLGEILRRVGGLRAGTARPTDREERVQRWCPTGGNLGSVEIFVGSRGVAGLPPGWYFYQADRHDLASLGPIIEAIDPRAAAVLVLAAAHARVRTKYGPFAYRVVHLDGGVALGQLLAVAAGYGVRADVQTTWDDRGLLRALELDGDSAIVAVAALLEPSPSRSPMEVMP